MEVGASCPFTLLASLRRSFAARTSRGWTHRSWKMHSQRRPNPLKCCTPEPSADSPLIRSGSQFTHLYLVQHGIVVPWQYPHSELAAPFLIGEHEFLMDAERWVRELLGDHRVRCRRRTGARDGARRASFPSRARPNAPTGHAAPITLLLDIAGYQRQPSLPGWRRPWFPGLLSSARITAGIAASMSGRKILPA